MGFWIKIAKEGTLGLVDRMRADRTNVGRFGFRFGGTRVRMDVAAAKK